MLKAVIFDLDGLLVDSTKLQIQADQEFIKSFGKIFLPGGGREGMRIIDITREYKDVYDLPGSAEDLYAKRQQIFFGLARKYLQLFNGVMPLLNKLQERKLKIALATSGDREYVKLVFEKFPQLTDYFSVVVSSEDVARGKPNPDVYKKALEKLKIKSDEAVVLEDSVNGITAAKLAGIQVICIPNRFYPEADYSQADKIFSSLGQVYTAIP